MKSSNLQINIYDAVKNTTGNICVKATAGAGKTTTLLECLRLVPKIARSIFVAFNKSIVDELRTRVPQHIKTSTLHSLGYAYIRNYFSTTKNGKQIRVDDSKYFTRALKRIEKSRPSGPLKKDDFKLAYRIQDIVNYARMTLTPHETEMLRQMCDHFTIEWSPEALSIAVELLANSLANPDIIDFTDMIWYPSMIREMVTDKFDYTFLDEAQDLNKCQFQFLESLINPSKGRLIAVGDVYQTIYGFAGADVDSFQRIMNRPNTITLPLNRTYRCAKQIVASVQDICPEIEAHEDAVEGEVRYGNFEEIREGDMVVSRITKPLISLYFSLLERNIKARVIGKDIESGLNALAEACASKTKEGVLYNLKQKLNDLEKELSEYGIKAPTEHARYRNLEEKIQVIILILGKISSASGLTAKIHEIFKEDRLAAKLMTIHRSKGLECDRVFIVKNFNNSATMPSKWATKSWELIQERNLIFVAGTRAKTQVIYLSISE